MLRGNPILAREIRTGLRGRRAFVVRTAFVAVLSIVVIATWGGALMDVSGGVKGATVDIRAIPGLGRQLFTSFGLALLVLLLAVVPGYAAGAISGEREKQTLESTLCTHLKPRHVVTGKLGACIMLSLALILSSLPAMGAVFLLGGVSPLEVALVFVILFATAVFVSALSLYVSAVCRRTYAAIMITYVIIAALHFGLIGVFRGCAEEPIRGSSGGDDSAVVASYVGQQTANAICLLDPYWSMADIFEGAKAAPPTPEGSLEAAPEGSPPGADILFDSSEGDEAVAGETPEQPEEQTAGGLVGGLVAFLGGPERAKFALVHLRTVATLVLLVCLLLVAAARRVARLEAPARSGPIERLLRRVVAWQERRGGGRQRARRGVPAFARGRAWNWLANHVSNPVFARDLRGRMLGRFGLLTKSACLGLIGVGVASVAVPALMIFPENAVRAMLLSIAVIPVLGGILAATSIAVEKEQRTFEMILATPMKSRAIVFGKLAGAFYHTQPLILLALPIVAFTVYLRTLTWHSGAWMLAFAELFALAACAVGVLASLLAQKASQAVTATLLIVGLALAGPFIAKGLGLMRIFVAGQESRGEMWLGPGPLASVYDVLLRPDLHVTSAEWTSGVSAGITVFAFVLALLLFRRAAGRLAEGR
ncbi:MAG: ABC transporter permease subunit [Armatimonadota bacterium]